MVALGLDMDLADQGAGRIDKDHLAAAGLGGDGLGHTMGREDHRPVGGAFVQFFDKDRALVAQAVNDEFVMHDLVADIDRRAPFLTRHFDDLDGPVDTGTKAARRGQIKRKRGLCVFHAKGLTRLGRKIQWTRSPRATL